MIAAKRYLAIHQERLEGAMCAAMDATLLAQPNDPVRFCAGRLAALATDHAMEQYFDELFFKGKGVFDIRHVLYSYGYVLNRATNKATLPATHRATSGFKRLKSSTFGHHRDGIVDCGQRAHRRSSAHR